MGNQAWKQGTGTQRGETVSQKSLQWLYSFIKERQWQYGMMAFVFLWTAVGLGCTVANDTGEAIHVGLIVYDDDVYGKTSGVGTRTGAQLAVDEINQAGGLLVNGTHYPVELVIETTEGNKPEAAVVAAYRLVNQNEVVALIGPQFSGDATAVAAVAENIPLPMISPMGTNPAVTEGKSYVFRAGFTDPFQGHVMAQFALQDLGVHTAALLYDVSNSYSHGIADIFQEQFTELGGQVVAVETYTSDDMADFTEQLTKIKATKPDVLFLPNYREQIYIQAQEARDLGLEAVFLGSDSWGGMDITTHPELINAFYSHHWHIASTNPRSQQFVAAYQKTYPDQELFVSAALTYDAMNLLFQAIQTSGSLKADKIRDGLMNLDDFSGVSGAIRYEGSGDPVKSAVIMQLTETGPQFYELITP